MLREVAKAVGDLTGSISTLSKLLRAAGAIVATATLVSVTAWGLGFFGRIRLDPPAQLAPPRATP